MNIYTFYKIVCLDENIKECYVGSSKSFEVRKRNHKCNCYNENRKDYNLKVYQFIRDNGGFDKFEFVVLEEKECDKNEALWIERKYINELNCDLNNRKPIIPKEEKKDEKKEYDKEYRETNKDKRKEYRKEHYERNKEKLKEQIKCECGSIVSRNNIVKHKKSKKHQLFISNQLI